MGASAGWEMPSTPKHYRSISLDVASSALETKLSTVVQAALFRCTTILWPPPKLRRVLRRQRQRQRIKELLKQVRLPRRQQPLLPRQAYAQPQQPAQLRWLARGRTEPSTRPAMAPQLSTSSPSAISITRAVICVALAWESPRWKTASVSVSTRLAAPISYGFLENLLVLVTGRVGSGRTLRIVSRVPRVPIFFAKADWSRRWCLGCSTTQPDSNCVSVDALGRPFVPCNSTVR